MGCGDDTLRKTTNSIKKKKEGNEISVDPANQYLVIIMKHLCVAVSHQVRAAGFVQAFDLLDFE